MVQVMDCLQTLCLTPMLTLLVLCIKHLLHAPNRSHLYSECSVKGSTCRISSCMNCFKLPINKQDVIQQRNESLHASLSCIEQPVRTIVSGPFLRGKGRN